MSALNPYADFVGENDPFQLIADAPQRLAKVFKQLNPEGIERSLCPGKWTARQILCHLADTEIAFAFRLRQSAAEPNHLIQPFDQDAWAKQYGELPAREALDAFTAFRRWNVAFLGALPEEVFSRPVTHPERGTMTFRVILETMAGHDLNHLGQLETIAAAAASK